MPTFEPGRLATAGAIGAALSALGNLVVYGVGTAAGGISIPDQANPGTFIALPAVLVVIASVVPALFGTGFYAALVKLAPTRARAVFIGISAVFTVLSMGGPAGAPDTLSMVALGAMHVVSALAIAGALVSRGTR